MGSNIPLDAMHQFRWCIYHTIATSTVFPLRVGIHNSSLEFIPSCRQLDNGFEKQTRMHSNDHGI